MRYRIPSLLFFGSATLAFGSTTGCKKKTYESCLADCEKSEQKVYENCIDKRDASVCERERETERILCPRVCKLKFGDQRTSTTPTRPSSNYPGTEEGAQALLAEFVKPGADASALSKALRPSSDDYRAIFEGQTASDMESAASAAWDSGALVIKGKAEQTEIRIKSATTEDLRAQNPAGKEFPGGYARVAQHLKPGLLVYRFSFIEPGHDLGMAYDGLYFVNGHWVIIPKPWRMLKHVQDTPSSDDPIVPATPDTTTPTSNPAAPAPKAPRGLADVATAGRNPPATTASSGAGSKGTVRPGAAQVNGRLPPEVIQRVVRTRTASYRACYEQGLRTDPALSGNVTVRFVIGRDGAVSSASNASSTLPATVASCVVRQFASLQFPQPEGGIVTVNYPLTFSPAK
jgi:hypothetical protein